MTKTKGIIYAIASALVVLALWFYRHKADIKVDAQIKSTVLPAADEEKLIVLPNSHTIETVTRTASGGTKVTKKFLPSSGASVDIRKDGSVAITTRSWGTEVSPFVGGAFGSDIVGRAALGVNLFYVQRWELGGGLLLNSHMNDTRGFAHVSYNFYKNAFVSCGLDNRKTVHVIVGLKF